MNINCKIKLAPGAKMPTRAHDTDTGYDVYAYSIKIHNIYGGEAFSMTEGESALRLSLDHDCLAGIDYILIDTGVSVTPPAGYASVLCARSSLAKSGLIIPNGLGIIDHDYTGSVKLILRPSIARCGLDKIVVGESIGQLIFHPVISATFEQVDELPATARGTGGFGSTGNN